MIIPKICFAENRYFKIYIKIESFLKSFLTLFFDEFYIIWYNADMCKSNFWSFSEGILKDFFQSWIKKLMQKKLRGEKLWQTKKYFTGKG